MKKNRDRIVSIQSIMCAIMFAIMLILLNSNIIVYFVLSLAIVAYFWFIKKKKKVIFNKLELWMFFIIAVLNILLYVVKKFNILENLSSVHEIKNFILSTKQWGIIILILLEILQVLVLPIPSIFLTLASVSIYGPKITIIVLGTTLVLSSCVAFSIGKIWGSRAIIKFVGEKKYETYKSLLNKNTKIFLPIMFILPFFPDDILCLLAGTTNLKFHEFIIISVLCRPISIIVVSLIGEYLIELILNMPFLIVIFWIVVLIFVLRILFKNKNKILSSIKKLVRSKRN